MTAGNNRPSDGKISLPPTALDEVPVIIREVMSEEQATEYVEERRINMICELAGQRIDYLRSM